VVIKIYDYSVDCNKAMKKFDFDLDPDTVKHIILHMKFSHAYLVRVVVRRRHTWLYITLTHTGEIIVEDDETFCAHWNERPVAEPTDEESRPRKTCRPAILSPRTRKRLEKKGPAVLPTTDEETHKKKRLAVLPSTYKKSHKKKKSVLLSATDLEAHRTEMPTHAIHFRHSPYKNNKAKSFRKKKVLEFTVKNIE